MKYAIWGQSIDYNFGVESLVAGTCQIIRSLDEAADMIYLQPSRLSENAKIGLERLAVKPITTNGGIKVLFDSVLCRFKLKNQSKSAFLNELLDCDIIIDCYGIYFCNRFAKQKMPFLKSLLSIYRQFQICVLGKILKKNTIKTPASYGPIDQLQDIRAAKYVANRVFDYIFAREKESQKELQKYTKKKIAVLPDVANAIPFEKDTNQMNTFGMAVSSQIVRKWKAKESYVDCVVKMIQYVIENLGMRVVIYPNEVHKSNAYNDLSLAMEIATYFSTDDRVSVFDSLNMTHMEQRNSIASCELFYSSRYHGCVAALSAGVPTMVIGWHVKYIDLMENYEQMEYLIPESEVSSDLLIEKIEKLNANKNFISHKLFERSEIIRSKLYGEFETIIKYCKTH